MAFDREAAKADGYTDEEIDQYLATKDQPLPPDTMIDRSQEQLGTAQAVGTGVAAAVAPYALAAPAAYGGYRMYNAAKQGAEAAKALADAKMASEQGIAQRALAKAGAGMSPPMPAQTLGPTTPVQPVPQMQAAKSIVQKLALDKVMQGAGAVAKMAGPATGMAMNLFGTSPEEIAILKAAEARKRALGQ